MGAVILHCLKFSIEFHQANSFSLNNQKPGLAFNQGGICNLSVFKYLYPTHGDVNSEKIEVSYAH